MKKKTIKNLMSILIALFMVSSIFFYGSRNNAQSTAEKKPDKLIYSEELPEDTELSFIKQGYTVARYYYPSMCLDCGPFIQELEYAVNDRLDKQLILEEIQVDEYEKKLPYMYLKSLKSIEEIEGLKNITQFYDKACLVLVREPLECANLSPS